MVVAFDPSLARLLDRCLLVICSRERASERTSGVSHATPFQSNEAEQSRAGTWHSRRRRRLNRFSRSCARKRSFGSNLRSRRVDWTQGLRDSGREGGLAHGRPRGRDRGRPGPLLRLHRRDDHSDPSRDRRTDGFVHRRSHCLKCRTNLPQKEPTPPLGYRPKRCADPRRDDATDKRRGGGGCSRRLTRSSFLRQEFDQDTVARVTSWIGRRRSPPQRHTPRLERERRHLMGR